MSTWRLEETDNGLRLAPLRRRALGSAEFTWENLLYRQLDSVQVYALYFPSRFDLALDAAVKAALDSFGKATGAGTSVNVWDPTDPEFSRALAFFHLKAPPALVLATGQQAEGKRPPDGDPALYSITLSDTALLGNRERLAAAVNRAHEIMVRGDRREIARHVRGQDAVRLLETVARAAGGVRDEILKLKPKFGLPGGISVQLG